MNRTKEAKKSFLRGKKAYRVGMILCANPYTENTDDSTDESVKYESWRNGWLHQKYLDSRKGAAVLEQL